jgi:hypothetical protein
VKIIRLEIELFESISGKKPPINANNMHKKIFLNVLSCSSKNIILDTSPNEIEPITCVLKFAIDEVPIRLYC